MPASDLLVGKALEELGHGVRGVRWDAGDSTEGFDLLVFRSCWNYHLRLKDFTEWLRTLESVKRVINPLDLVWWNIDKRYLLSLAKSVPVVPTEVVDDPTPESVRAVCLARGWPEAVVKPIVGSTAYRTKRLLTPDDFESLGHEDVSGSILVQPYLASVETQGEFSLAFFDGEYSHAVLKRPALGDYRVQEEHGGSTEAIEPTPELRQTALNAIAALPKKPVYARVDLVEGPHGPMVMELELIEPELYVDHVPSAANRFARAILAQLE